MTVQVEPSRSTERVGKNPITKMEYLDLSDRIVALRRGTFAVGPQLDYGLLKRSVSHACSDENGGMIDKLGDLRRHHRRGSPTPYLLRCTRRICRTLYSTTKAYTHTSPKLHRVLYTFASVRYRLNRIR